MVFLRIENIWCQIEKMSYCVFYNCGISRRYVGYIRMAYAEKDPIILLAFMLCYEKKSNYALFTVENF